jgi:flavodoxin I
MVAFSAFAFVCASADRQLFQPGFLASPYATGVSPQTYAPAYAQPAYASPSAYASPEYVQYDYPETYAYTPVYEQDSSYGTLDVVMLAVAGAAVGAAVGTYASRGAARASTPEMKAALLYSTTTGNTETAAGYIAEATGLEAVDIGDADVETIKECDSLIVGAPTWHTGADTERSGTAWDEFLYGDLTSLDLKGKKVAIFGMGDQSGYADNYVDVMDELESCFKAQGAEVVGAWPTEGYDHEDSKSVRGDNFVGLALDEDNQPELSEERAQKWVEQIKGEGISL